MSPGIIRLLDEVHVLGQDERNRAIVAGEAFNIFEVLEIGSLETLTHSPVLAELLSPSGRHGMGAAFLELFVTEFELGLEPTKTRIMLEYHIGPVNDTFTSGGRIDILLTDTANLLSDTANVILIENKIHGADQRNQLFRYQKAFPKATIIYLTLDGRKSTNGQYDANRVQNLSYKEDIIKWLGQCLNKFSDRPVLRANIIQYINLLKTLTGQSFMNTEIAKLAMQDENNLVAYFELAQSKTAVIQKVIDRLRAHVDEIAKDLKLEREFPPGELYARQSTFYFWDAQMRENNVRIAFQFREAEHRGLTFGIAYFKHGPPEVAPPGIFEGFQQVFRECRPSPNYWPALANWVKRYDWSADAYAAICFGEQFKGELREKVEILAKIVRSAISAGSEFPSRSTITNTVPTKSPSE